MAVVTRSQNLGNSSATTTSGAEDRTSSGAENGEYRVSTSSGASASSTSTACHIDHFNSLTARPISSSSTSQQAAMPKRKIRQAAGASLTVQGSRKSSLPDSNEHHHFGSLRRVIGSSKSSKDNKESRRRSLSSGGSTTQKNSRPCPPITIQTKDISWPIGSGGERDSPQLDEYDLVSSRDFRPVSAGAAARSFEIHREPASASASASSTAIAIAASSSTVGHHGSQMKTFPLSYQRAMAVSKNKQPLLIRTRRACTADSLDSVTVNTAPYTAEPPHSASASASASIAALNSAPATADASGATTVYMHRSYSNGSSPMPMSPSTPASAFSYVSVNSPISLKSPVNATYSSSGTRLRRAGTLDGPPLPSASRAAERRNNCLHSSYNSLVLAKSNSTASTVVSSSSSLTSSNRPTSLDRIVAGKRGSSNSNSNSNRNSSSSSNKRSPKKPLTDDDELRGTPPRDDWDIVFDRIKEYRATHEAPVDTVGCEALTAEEKDPKMQRFRSLVSLMLSAQTKDEITAEAVRNLSQRLPGGLTPRSLSEAPMDLIHECVRRVGFWQRKSNYIKEAARVCLEQHDSDIPRTVPQLLSLPGVGPKMAYLVMHAAWQDNQGIGVDTHVLRITHRLGWVSDLAKTPEATRHSLESWLPKSLWREINPLLVGLGQTVCRGVGPKCGECPVSQFCPSAQLKSKAGLSRSGRKSLEQASQETVISEPTELADVDVEDLASMVRGAEQAIRSRKGSGGRSRKALVVKAEFPEIPDSPMPRSRPADVADGTLSDGYRTRARTRSRAYSRRFLRSMKMPFPQDNDVDTEAEGSGYGSHTSAGYSDAKAAEMADEFGADPGRRPKKEVVTSATSPYFMRSRSNAASEEVRPEAKTATVRTARARASAKKLYSRRLSKSDMQWALGEDWDPEGSSSLSDSELADHESKVKQEECENP
ncbi:alpha,alpha-trehalase nth1 [Coemansia asiatica]|uniref:Endonuclease III homolog n=1 Tax=Coemansia asiatica TaxID=1052880 RepID=A0A9W7XJF9_9FUNG|nr:alpha,alpha-trehalase nth1 [Coemansia asiatica]